jgi:hypothetical protein
MHQYPKIVTAAAEAACALLYDKFPQLKTMHFDNHGFPASGGVPFVARLEMSIYLELIKANIEPEKAS